jgi:hypothetical protein
MVFSTSCSRVTLPNDLPKVHTIALQSQSWQNGESPIEPSDHELKKAKALTEQALSAAAKQEIEDSARTPARQPAIFFAPASKPQSMAQPATSNPPVAPTQLRRAHAVRRKEVPLRLVRSGNDARSHPERGSASTHEMRRLKSSGTLGTRTSQAVQSGNWHNSSLGFSMLATKAIKKATEKAVKTAARVEEVVHDARAHLAKRENG